MDSKPSIFKEYPDHPHICLPQTSFHINTSLSETILKRRSLRDFMLKSLSLESLSKLLWFGYGIVKLSTSDSPEIAFRPAPSAGALYPCEIYPVVLNVDGLQNGIYHYCPLYHSLEFLRSGHFAIELAELLWANIISLDQMFV